MRGRQVVGVVGRAAAAVCVMAVGASAAFAATARSPAARWGVTAEQASAPMPGDDLVRGASSQTTRGVTIDAPIADVWPWVAQLGAGRGGLYSYDWLERLVGANIRNVDRVLPGEQHPAVGDPVWITPEGYPANLVFKVASVDPGRSLVLAQTDRPGDPGLPADPGWTWSIVLRPVDARTTQLILRDRQQPFPNPVARALNAGLIEPIGFAMERKMLLGIERRAELLAGTAAGGGSPAEPVWFAAMLAGAVAAVAGGSTRRRPWWWRLGLAAASGFVLGVALFDANANPAAALAADAGIGAAVWLTIRRPPAGRSPVAVEHAEPMEGPLERSA